MLAGTSLETSSASSTPEDRAMISRVRSPRFRKFSPIDREYPIYELVDGDTILLDIAASDEGEIEVSLHEGSANRTFSYDQLLQLLAEGRRILEEDMK